MSVREIKDALTTAYSANVRCEDVCQQLHGWLASAFIKLPSIPYKHVCELV